MMAFFQNKALLPVSIRSLADDHARYLLGKGPTAYDMEKAPVVRDWRIARTHSRRLEGVLEADGRRLDDNNSLIWTINLEKKWVRTTEGLYRLGGSDLNSLADFDAAQIHDIGGSVLVCY